MADSAGPRSPAAGPGPSAAGPGGEYTDRDVSILPSLRAAADSADNYSDAGRGRATGIVTQACVRMSRRRFTLPVPATVTVPASATAASPPGRRRRELRMRRLGETRDSGSEGLGGLGKDLERTWRNESGS